MKEKKFLTVIMTLLIASLAIIFINTQMISAKNVSKKQAQIVNKNTADEKLALIDKYQKKYFEIVKRNDVLLFFDDVPELNNDRDELKKLFAEVQKQVKNKNYLKEYKQIEKRYSECGELTTPGINEFAQNHYKEVDALLNTVYKEVQSKISPEDFKKLSQSEENWLKEIETYQKTYNAMEFGSLGTSMYYDYQTDMKNFRILLLMLYL